VSENDGAQSAAGALKPSIINGLYSKVAKNDFYAIADTFKANAHGAYWHPAPW
jgi:hypothetical protein